MPPRRAAAKAEEAEQSSSSQAASSSAEEEEQEEEEEQVVDIEERRKQNMLANRKRLEALGVLDAAAALDATKAEKKKKERKSKPKPAEGEEAEIRRSGRERSSVTYKEEDYLTELRHLGGGGGGGPRVRREVDEEALEELRQKHGVAAPPGDEEAEGDETDGDGKSKKKGKGRGNIDSGKGVRLQGGRVYDSKFGITCHWCRQKTLEEHVTCTHPNCGKGKRLATTFCKGCLRNRHGEDSIAAAESGTWQCPQCRGSCGPGCVACCNCGPCRKKLNLEPTGQIIGMARQAGFYNVHDYLVHVVTGETPEEISARKLKFRWGRWLAGDDAPPLEEEEEGGVCGACQDGVPCSVHPTATTAAEEEGGGKKARKRAPRGKKAEVEGGEAAAPKPAKRVRKRAAAKAAEGQEDTEAGEGEEAAEAEQPEGGAAKGKKPRKAPAASTAAASSRKRGKAQQGAKEDAAAGGGGEGEGGCQGDEENEAPAPAQRPGKKLASKLQAAGRSASAAPAPAGPASGGAEGVVPPAPTATVAAAAATAAPALPPGVALTKRQAKQLELGLVSLEDLLTQLKGKQPLAPVENANCAA